MTSGTAPATIAVANAPCSWGVMEGFESSPSVPGYGLVLDEIALAGYQGTELGDWGFMPTSPSDLRAELARRGLALVGAFVPVALAKTSAHDAGMEAAVRAARLLAETVGQGPGSGTPVIVLADDAGVHPVRTKLAGRIGPEYGLSRDDWQLVARGAERIARAVRDETGLRTAFHHHCGGFVEAPTELETLMDITDANVIGLCLDTGHYTYGGGDALEALQRYGERVWHVHFKDCEGEVAARARSEEWDYFTAVRKGVFCELGAGAIDFPTILAELRRRDYRGWIVVEQDVAPGTGTPLESARRAREYLRRLGV